jgi:uncharacterized protein YdhG (YjbR/CyaY superfamily)
VPAALFLIKKGKKNEFIEEVRYNENMNTPGTRTDDYSTIDEYIALFSGDIRHILTRIRETVRTAAPEALEKISYRMPTFFQRENLVHFAAMKNHIGFYPGAEGVAAFADQLGAYQTSKGAIRFPLTEPIPYTLISRITRFRVRAVQKQGRT